MTDFTENNAFDATVHQIATTEKVTGGGGGSINAPLQSLVNRTRWLVTQVQAILTAIGLLAPKDSPTFTGSPEAPTAAAGTSSTQLATTAFVQNETLVRMAPTASATITPLANVTVVQPTNLTSDATITVVGGSKAGQRVRVYGAAGHAVTVASSVSSGSPLFAFPDDTGAYSYTLPAVREVFIDLVWDESDYRAGSPLFSKSPSASDNSSRVPTTSWLYTCMNYVASAAGFAYSWTNPGYIRLPSWLGGFQICWGTGQNTSAGVGQDVYFYTPFLNSCLGVVVCEGAASNASWGVGVPTLHASGEMSTSHFNEFRLYWSASGPGWAGGGSVTYNYIAVGR